MGGLTTLSVPTITSDGALLLLTICEIKYAAIPMMATRDTPWRIRTTLKVVPRAPLSDPAMVIDLVLCLSSRVIFREYVESLRSDDQRKCKGQRDTAVVLK